MIAFIKRSIAATLALLLAVMLVQWTLQLAGHIPLKATGELSGNMALWGFIADLTRGCMLAYLYPQLKNTGSLRHAIKFGMATSLLAASLWVIYQYGVRASLGVQWLAEESAITLLQGLLSGVALWWANRHTASNES
jgi:hypothetical protein